MNQKIKDKIGTMFWDLPSSARKKAVESVINDPLKAFNDDGILLKALNTFSWYELMQLAGGPENLTRLLDDRIIKKLFPESRRKYYTDGKRLLSKYIISPAVRSFRTFESISRGRLMESDCESGSEEGEEFLAVPKAPDSYRDGIADGGRRGSQRIDMNNNKLSIRVSDRK